MDPNYETVVEVAGLVWTLVAYLLHGVIVVVHASLACFLLGTGAHNLLFPDLDGVWLRRLGASGIGTPPTRVFGAIRVALGLLLLAPLLVGAPTAVSLIAVLAAFVLLILIERRTLAGDRLPGRFIRRVSIGFAGVAALFMLWEGEDNLALGADLFQHSAEWRNEEVAWQLALDPASPKVGDLAPDFSLQDPDGKVQVRLSDFRGKRPVALVFGSYT
jgi:hypothetical protein